MELDATTLGEVDYFKQLAQQLNDADHGDRGRIIEAATGFLGMSRDAVYRRLKKIGWQSGRKLRTDRGDSQLSDDEARSVATIMVESTRANGKRLLSVGDALEIAKGNGLIQSPVSGTTALRIMRSKGFHPDQIARPTPHQNLRSMHPNHTWQFDVSVCVLYYLDTGGMAVMDQNRFYKNKPDNVKKVEKFRVLRYLATDHYSGTLYVHYYRTSGENQETLFDFFMAAFAKSDHEQDPFHGVPLQLIWDAGSANQSHLIKNLLDRLTVKHWAHLPGNPRAKGQVENGHNIVERKFEGRLSLMRITSMEHLNECAQLWMRHFNGTAKHSRHGHTRYALWQTVRPEQLRICPPRIVCEQLLRTKPVERQVRGNLVIHYTVKGFSAGIYSVAHIPNVRVGESLNVCVNPYSAPNLFVIDTDEHGNEVHYECKPIARDQAGFMVDAPVIGERFKAPRDTDTDKHRKRMAKDAYDADTELQVDKARKNREPAFGGRIDPFGYLPEQTPAHYMPRKGSALDVPDPVAIESSTRTVTECARYLKSLLGNVDVNFYDLVMANYPSGATDEQIKDLAKSMSEPQPTGFRVVNGGSNAND